MAEAIGRQSMAGGGRSRGLTASVYPRRDWSRFRRRVVRLAENQIAGCAAFALGLGLVPRPGKARPRLAPVVGALRRPCKVARSDQMVERPGRIVRDVAREPELTARPQDTGDRGDALVLHETSFPMPAFRPGVGIDEIDARERGRGQPGHKLRCIAMMEPDVR